jgi:lipopolysaccharide/colanic/teichoic acid biosynthesis glycosyltransferase
MKTTIFVTLCVGVVARFMGDEVKSWSAWLHKRIRRAAVAQLPKDCRERYDEEWESGLEEFPGEIFKLIYSIGLLRAALDIRKAILRRAENSRTNFGRVKRVFDVLFSVATIVAILPSLIAIVIAIKLEAGGPVFSFSKRIGKKGRVFHCIKFRTMRLDTKVRLEDVQMDGRRVGIFEIAYDAHITGVGRFLRKYSLDELPVLFNILKGDMSFVGPLAPIHNENNYEHSYLRQFNLTPGLTGLWQVQTRRDRSLLSPESLYETYAKNSSIWLDFKIIARTMKSVLQGRD